MLKAIKNKDGYLEISLNEKLICDDNYIGNSRSFDVKNNTVHIYDGNKHIIYTVEGEFVKVITRHEDKIADIWYISGYNRTAKCFNDHDYCSVCGNKKTKFIHINDWGVSFWICSDCIEAFKKILK